MAAQEGGATTTTTSSYGKFRKKPFRRQTTPYDRPPTALRLPNNTSSWWTKLVVDPASKLISYGSERFLAPLLRKRLAPPPPPPPPPRSTEVNDDTGDGVQEAVPNNQCGTQEPAVGQCSQTLITSSSSRISELEQLLKQKTFTRSEINHLTELLQSRAVEMSIGNHAEKHEETASDSQRHQQFERGPLEEIRTEIRSTTVMSTPVSNSKVLEDEIASPAELAKAYMGSRPSKVSPSVLGIRSQVGREDTGLLSNIPFASKSHMALTAKTPVSLGAPENGFITPRSRGRSAIYNMARTPYSKLKGSGVNSNGYPGQSVPTSALSLMEHDNKFGSKSMTLKRRSSVLDDEVGSVGPIRRIRQKSNLLAPKIHHGAHEMGSDAKQKLAIIDEPRQKVSKNIVENENENVPSTSYAPVPSKSSEVAARILQHLERMTPKEKSSSKLVAVRDKASLKLTPNMLSGQALRSMEFVDSSKFLLDVQDDHKLGDRSNAALPDARDSTSQKQGKLEENGLKESVVSSVTWNPAMNNDSAVSLKAPGPSSGTSDSAVKNGPSQPPQKKRAFRMSAQEESLEQEDDVYCNDLAARPLSERRGPMEAHLTVSKLGSYEEPKMVKTILQSEMKSPSGFVLSKTNELSSRDSVTVGEESSTIGFPTSEQATAASQSAVLPISVATFDRPKETNNPPPLFSFSSTVADKFPSLPLEPSSKKTESKLENSSSLVNVSASMGSQVGIPVLEKDGHLNPKKTGDINGKYDAVSSVASDGPPVSRPLLSFTAASSNDTNQTSTGGALLFTSSTSASNSVPAGTGTSTSTSANSSGSIFGLAATPSVLAEPVFKFGASVDPPLFVSAVSTTNVPEMIKPEINPSSGSSHPTVAAANAGSSTFGLGSSFSYSTVKNPLDSLSSTSAGNSLVSGPGTVSQGISVQSASSASLPSFNINSSTSFGSSLSNPQVFNQQSSFGFSSAASTSDTSAVVPSSAPTSSLFKFSASSSDGNAVSPSSGANPGMFSFGISSSSSTNAVGSSSGATPPLFGFGASSSASVTSTAIPFGSGNPGILNLGGSSSAASSAISSNSASSWQTPTSSIFGSTFTSQSAATGFSFGASSTPSAPTNVAPTLFNSSTASLASPFSFTAAPASVPNIQPVFGNAQSVFGNPSMTGFGASPGKNDQMNAEDSMAEDTVQSSSVAAFGQPSSSMGFAFGSTAPSQPSNPFMFGGSQQNQNQPPFQASGSLEFSAGGSFSLGSGGGDKSGRKMIKVNRNKNRRK
ncbi:hypothetical protein BUALT_Bualt06G0043400 [Buddleja alternifolia]|uniref:Nuclear pore complex protein n=1 Tax=Buddleja alternifolia TaxID=168488 RepID=A0AAV6XL18_9LAMI|nr:hypothetical protein BUALT_Bualt06G0043400 [Buddleja alternifolia]